MSVIPSHSLWSSIKIPLSKYAVREKKKTLTSVPYVDFCFNMNQKNSGKPVKEISNLTVPNNLRKEKEYSIPEIFCVCSKKKKGSRKKLPQIINFLRVPDFDKEQNKRAEKFYTNPGYKRGTKKNEDINLEEKFLELTFEGDKGEFAYVPSIKPWTLEELNELHRRYGMKDEEVTMAAEYKKNKRRGITTECAHNVSNLTKKILNLKNIASRKSINSKFNEDFDLYVNEFYDCEQASIYSEFDLNPNEQFHTSKYSKTGSASKTARTEAKLTELYMLEFDIKG